MKLQKDNTQFIVSVKDEGPGFSSDDLKKMYRKFDIRNITSIV